MNEAIAVARLEQIVSLIGCAGNDIEADIIYDLLKTDIIVLQLEKLYLLFL